MNSNLKLLGALATIGLLASTTPASALPTLSWTDGATNYSIDLFGGFDWNSAGSAVTGPFVLDGTTTFNTAFMSNAAIVKNIGGGNFVLPGLGVDYEFTIYADIVETGVLLGGTTASFSAVSGTYYIYYDDVANSDLTTGAGMTDGTLILQGSIIPGFAGTFTGAGSGIGIFNFDATVDYTNNTFINPDLDFSNSVATLQLGTNTTAWTQPSTFAALGGGTTPIAAGSTVFQADGNTAFTSTTVPEPGTIALLSLGLLGFAGVNKRRHSSSNA